MHCSVACYYTKLHCDETQQHTGGHRNTPFEFHSAAYVLWLSRENCVSLLIKRLIVLIRPLKSVETVTGCRANIHMNTEINTYTSSLNALLCPRRSDFEMKRCINKTLPAVKKRSMQDPHLSWPDINTRVQGSSGHIPLCLRISQISEEAVSFFSVPSLWQWFGSKSILSLSQMGAVLHFEPVALWESSTALPVGILVGYLRERVRSDQVPTHGPKNYGQHLSFWS